jgi:hypothetical protein
MRLFLFLALILAGSGVCPADQPAPDGWQRPTVTIYTQFQSNPPGYVLEALRREVSSVLGPIGVHFDWRSLDDPRANQPVAELVVIKFKGRCQAVEGLAGAMQAGALGWTHISDGDMLPFSDIDCDRTWRFVQPALVGSEEEQQNRIFGRALGRVLAHELYHIFANTTKHAGEGLAKACYTSDELLSAQFHFSDREFKMIRGGKLRNLLRQQPAMADAAGGQ